MVLILVLHGRAKMATDRRCCVVLLVLLYCVAATVLLLLHLLLVFCVYMILALHDWYWNWYDMAEPKSIRTVAAAFCAGVFVFVLLQRCCCCYT